MNTAVIYFSQTGFTARYARWISQAAGADCLDLAAAKKARLDAYDAIIFGSWVRAGTVCKLNWLRRNLDTVWAGKKVILFCVGGSPIDNPETREFLGNLRAELKGVEVFYCPGGFRYENMSILSKLMMKAFWKAFSVKKDKTPADEEMLRMISSSCDFSDRKYIQPVLESLNR